MKRWIRTGALTLTLGLMVALGAASFLTAPRALAQPASVGAPDSAKPYWQNRYRELKAQISSANMRLTQAKREYNKAKQRKRLRGDYKNSILMEIQNAEMELEDAQKALDALPEEARAAGVPPGWFREIDDDYPG